VTRHQGTITKSREIECVASLSRSQTNNINNKRERERERERNYFIINIKTGKLVIKLMVRMT